MCRKIGIGELMVSWVGSQMWDLTLELHRMLHTKEARSTNMIEYLLSDIEVFSRSKLAQNGKDFMCCTFPPQSKPKM